LFPSPSYFEPGFSKKISWYPTLNIMILPTTFLFELGFSYFELACTLKTCMFLMFLDFSGKSTD